MINRYILIVLICIYAIPVMSQGTAIPHYEELKKEKLSAFPVDRLLPLNLNAALSKSNRDQKVSNSEFVDEAEPFIALNPTDSNNLVLSYMLFSRDGLQFPVFYTRDGGKSWKLSEFHSHTAFFEDTTLTIIGGGDPMLAFDADGKLYFSWIVAAKERLAVNQYILHMYWGYSNDGGETWELEEGEDHFIGKGGSDDGFVMDYARGFFDKQWMACDQSNGPNRNTLYTSLLLLANPTSGFNDPVAGGVLFKKPADSTAFGQDLTHLSSNAYLGQMNNVLVDNQGRIHVSYLAISQNDETEGLFHRISNDGGQTFSPPVKIGDAFGLITNSAPILHNRENPAPNLAISPDGSHVYLTWSSKELLNGDLVMKGYFARSTDSGINWETPINIENMNGTTEFRHSLMPVIATNEVGHLSIAWYTAESTSSGNYILVESKDNGLSFSDPITLSSDNTRFSGNVMGDYNSLLRQGSKTYAVWSDGREWNNAIYFGAYDHAASVTSIMEFQPVNSLIDIQSVSPQPAHDHIHVAFHAQVNTMVTYSLFSLDGKEIIDPKDHMTPKGESHLELIIPSGTPAGMYVLYIKSEAGVISKKVVIQ